MALVVCFTIGDGCTTVISFSENNWIFPTFNSNLIALIRKFPKVDSLNLFRPIVMETFSFNIIINRLCVIAARIISPN